MPRTIHIMVDVSAMEPVSTYGDMSHNAGGNDLRLNVELVSSADSQGEAIVRGLRHASDVAAVRLGLPQAVIGPPAAVASVVDEIADEARAAWENGDSGRWKLLMDWAERIAAEYGWTLDPARFAATSEAAPRED